MYEGRFMNIETLFTLSIVFGTICFIFGFMIESNWKYIWLTGALISFISVCNIYKACHERQVFYRYANLNPEGWMYITGKGTDAYKVDLTKVKPGCHIVIYHAYDYHGPFFFSPKVLLIEPIKCGDRVANQAEIAYNGAE